MSSSSSWASTAKGSSTTCSRAALPRRSCATRLAPCSSCSIPSTTSSSLTSGSEASRAEPPCYSPLPTPPPTTPTNIRRPVTRVLASVLAFVAVSSVANAAEPAVAISPAAQRALLASNDPQLAANKKLVWDMWRNFLQAGRIDDADRYLAPEYHQHNPNAETGLEGVKAYFRAQNRQSTEVQNHIDRLVSIVAERDRKSVV